MDQALKFARLKHDGQKRKFSGEPYITHCINVYKSVIEVVNITSDTGITNIAIAALLHDIVEDTDTSINEIREIFGGRVAELVMALTNDPVQIERVGKTQYLSDKIVELDDDALLIKLADRLDNIQDLTNNSWSEKYAFQTIYVFHCGLRNRVLNDNHKILLSRIDSCIKKYIETMASKDIAPIMRLLMSS